MDSKNEVKVGDYVVYENGSIVVGENEKPLEVVAIKRKAGYNRCVIYCNGEFDNISDVRKCPALLLELL